MQILQIQRTGERSEGMSRYPESEYSTQNESMAAALIRAQGGVVKKNDTGEYIRSRNGKASDGNRK